MLEHSLHLAPKLGVRRGKRSQDLLDVPLDRYLALSTSVPRSPQSICARARLRQTARMPNRVLHQLLEVAETTDDVFQTQTEAVLAELVGCESAHLMTLDERYSQTAPEYMRLFTDNSRYSVPMLSAMHHVRHLGAFIDTEVIAPRERDRLAFYQEVLRPMGVSSQIVQLVRFRGQTLGVLHCNRFGTKSTPFDRDAVTRLSQPISLVAATLVARKATARVSGARTLGLTPREAEVAEYAARGFENAQIAAHLGRSLNTVRNQLHAAFRKLGIYSRVDLANAVFGRNDAIPDALSLSAKVSASKLDLS